MDEQKEADNKILQGKAEELVQKLKEAKAVTAATKQILHLGASRNPQEARRRWIIRSPRVLCLKQIEHEAESQFCWKAEWKVSKRANTKSVRYKESIKVATLTMYLAP
jgi:hypothetical protein